MSRLWFGYMSAVWAAVLFFAVLQKDYPVFALFGFIVGLGVWIYWGTIVCAFKGHDLHKYVANTEPDPAQYWCGRCGKEFWEERVVVVLLKH